MIILDGQSLTLENLVKVARDHEEVSISEKSKKLVIKASLFVEKVVDEGKPVYGINTGFGILANKRISDQDLKNLQRNLILSHAVGVGNSIPKEISRLMLQLIEYCPLHLLDVTSTHLG